MAEKIKNMLVTGSPNAEVKVILKNAAGQTYNPTTKVFETGSNEILVIIDPSGYANFPIIFPEISSDDTYDVSIKPVAGTKLGAKIPTRENIITTKDYVPKILTWTTSHATAGYTVAAALSTVFPGVAKSEVSNITTNALRNISLTGAVTKSSALLYVYDAPDITSATGGDFTNSNKTTYTIQLLDKSSGVVILDGDTNINDGMNVWGKNITEDVTMSKDGSNQITLSGYKVFPKIKPGDELTFSEGGWDVDIMQATVTGSGTTSLTATIIGQINRFGINDDTITLRLAESVTTVPNASDQSVTCVAGATVAVNCGLGDTDANASAKTYSRVAGPSRGTVGNNSTAFDNNSFTGTSITYNNTSGSATDTDTFTFKSRDAGGTYSATKTITITLT